MRSFLPTALLLGAALLGCEDDAVVPPPPGGQGAGGQQPAGCAPGELTTAAGCEPAGVAACAEGFTLGEDGGCAAVLPDGPCPAGQLAIPGEASCHELAPCPPGRWGDIPVDGTTQFVDGAYLGGDSDGTQDRPWVTVSQAIGAATSGSVVAIAAGTYQENLTVTKAMKLWGRCPALVEISGTAPLPYATIGIVSGAHGVEVHGLAITGASIGITVRGAVDVVLDRVWIHDTANRGLYLDDSYGASQAQLSSSLIEGSQRTGASIIGGSLAIESSAIRDIQPAPNGIGVACEDNADTGMRGTVQIRRSLIESCHTVGLTMGGGSADIETTVIRNIGFLEDGVSGTGIFGSAESLLGARNELSLTDSVVEGNEVSGIILVGTDGTIDSVTVRGNGWGGTGAAGLAVVDGPSVGRSDVLLRHVLLTGNGEVGVLVAGSSAQVEATAIHHTQPDADGEFGRAVQIQLGDTGPSQVSVRGSVLSHSSGFGMVVVDSHATVESCSIHDTHARQTDGLLGDGLSALSVEEPTWLEITGSRIATSDRAGITSFGAEVRVGATRLDCNSIDLHGEASALGPYEFVDLGGSSCGCGSDERACAVTTTHLEPPNPVE